MPSGRRSGAVVRDERPRGTVYRLRYQDATGRRVCETLGLELEGWTSRRAEEALRERLVDVKRDRLTRARPLRFEDFAKPAMEGYLDSKGRRFSTRYAYLNVLDVHLVPYFGKMRLDGIDVADVDAYVVKKRRSGLSGASVNRHLNVLRRVCRLAVRAGKMHANPVLGVESLEEPDRRLRWRRLQPEEVGAVAQAFDELITEADGDERPWVEQARVVFLVIYGIGLRRGEILGLRWRSIRLADPERRPTLSVDAAIVRSREGAPKSATSRRTLVLDEFIAGELFDHRGRSNFQGDGERVFCHPMKGSPLDVKRYAETFRTALSGPEWRATFDRSTTAGIRRSRTTPRPATQG